MKHMWSVAISILYLVAVATSAALPNGPVEKQYSVLPSDGVTPYNWNNHTGALPQNLRQIPRSTNIGSGILHKSFLLNDDVLDGLQTVAPRGAGLQRSCIPPGGRCHIRGSCCPASDGRTDVCGGNGICIVL